MPLHFLILAFSTPLVNVLKKINIQRLNPNTSIDFLAWTVSQIAASQGYFVTNTSEVLSLALKVISVDRKNPVKLIF